MSKKKNSMNDNQKNFKTLLNQKPLPSDKKNETKKEVGLGANKDDY
jgi:hypothetical protein